MNAIETSDLESATTRVLKKVSAEPAYTAVLYKILEFCEPSRSWDEIARKVASLPEMKTALQSPRVLLSWLVESGGVEQISAEAGDKSPRWRTTEAGMNLVRGESPSNRLMQMLARNPIYRDVYLNVLRSCAVPKARTEIESMLEDNPALENPKVYASVFIDSLERAGGLEWNEKWRTTEAGDALVAQSSSSAYTGRTSSQPTKEGRT